VIEKAKEAARTCQHVCMAWLDTVALNLMPMFIVMSVLSIFVVRQSGLWRGIGAAWLAAIIVAIAIAILNPDYWSLPCGWQNALRTGVGAVEPANPPQSPCAPANNLQLWLVGLPPLIGIGILVAWVWRHTRPPREAMQAIAILAGCAIGAVLVGQLNENLALVFVLAVVAAAYAWPRLQRQHAA
jgi:hypothetical protein